MIHSNRRPEVKTLFDSLNEFISCWLSKQKASFSIVCDEGHASINLSCNLGCPETFPNAEPKKTRKTPCKTRRNRARAIKHQNSVQNQSNLPKASTKLPAVSSPQERSATNPVNTVVQLPVFHPPETLRENLDQDTSLLVDLTNHTPRDDENEANIISEDDENESDEDENEVYKSYDRYEDDDYEGKSFENEDVDDNQDDQVDLGDRYEEDDYKDEESYDDDDIVCDNGNDYEDDEDKNENEDHRDDYNYDSEENENEFGVESEEHRDEYDEDDDKKKENANYEVEEYKRPVYLPIATPPAKLWEFPRIVQLPVWDPSDLGIFMMLKRNELQRTGEPDIKADIM